PGGRWLRAQASDREVEPPVPIQITRREAIRSRARRVVRRWRKGATPEPEEDRGLAGRGDGRRASGRDRQIQFSVRVQVRDRDRAARKAGGREARWSAEAAAGKSEQDRDGGAAKHRQVRLPVR